MSDGQPPSDAARTPSRPEAKPQGWLARLVRGAAYFFLRRDFHRLEAENAALGQALEGQSGELQELREHLETRANDSAAALDDLRQAYIATRTEFEEVRDRLASIAGVLQGELESLRDTRVPRVEGDLSLLQKAAGVLESELESLRDTRVPRVERNLGLMQKSAEALQAEILSVRDVRVPRAEADIASLQRALESVQAVAEELRDGRLPALSGRTDALVERLHEDLTEVTGLVERLVQHEPLRIGIAQEIEARIPEAVAAASTRFAQTFRGDRAEILGRAEEHVRALAGNSPVMDLGCGRGELLEALRNAGIEARGVDSDPAMVAGCRRLGLAVEERDAVGALQSSQPGSLGGVTAIHLVEHLPAAGWMTLVEAAAAALRPGGVLLVESPNPESLRVGAGLFWTDPTHRAPIHPDAMALVAKAVGLEVVEVRRLHPFPPEQALVRPDQPEPVRELASRLDSWLSGPRDVLLVARKP